MSRSVDDAAVLITNSHDQDMADLSQALTRRGVPNLLWSFDARDEELVVDAAPGRFRLQRDEQVLSSERLAAARVVVHRSGLGQQLCPVVTIQGSRREREFAGREWSSLIHGLLIEAEYRHEHLTWVNRPSTGLVAAKKYQLLATAELDGLRVPGLRVSTEGLLPHSSTDQYVCKAINEDENIDDRRVYATAVLDDEDVSAPFRTNVPSLIQERVRAQCELRLYCLLGAVLCLRVVTDTPDYADIRLVRPESVSIDQVAVPPALEDHVRRYCRRHRLAYCAFDFLRTADGQDLLIDVNPAGGWAFYETPGEPIVTEWYADTISRTISR